MWGGGVLIRIEVRPVFDFVFQAWFNFLTVGVGSAVTGEVVPLHAIEEYTENGVVAPLSLNLDIRWRSEGSFTSRMFDLRVNSPPLPTEYQSGRAAEAVWPFWKIKKNFWSLPGFILWFIRPVAQPLSSLFGLRSSYYIVNKARRFGLVAEWLKISHSKGSIRIGVFLA